LAGPRVVHEDGVLGHHGLLGPGDGATAMASARRPDRRRRPGPGCARQPNRWSPPSTSPPAGSSIAGSARPAAARTTARPPRAPATGAIAGPGPTMPAAKTGSGTSSRVVTRPATGASTDRSVSGMRPQLRDESGDQRAQARVAGEVLDQHAALGAVGQRDAP